MTRKRRILRAVALSLAGLILFLTLTAVIVLRSQWFRDYVRGKIIATAEESTGGKLEIGTFDFDWTHLRATLHNVVLHGTEPAKEAPLFQARLIQVDLKVFATPGQTIDLAALAVDHPQTNLLIAPDGSTNVPEPKVKKKSDTSALETVVDLKVGRFDLTDGTFRVNARKVNFDAKGDRLRAQLRYDGRIPGYQGDLKIAPLHLKPSGGEAIDLTVDLPVMLEKDRIQLNYATISTPGSKITVNGSLEHLASPKASAHLSGRLAIDDVRRISGAALPLEKGPGLPDTLDTDIALSLDQTTLRIPAARISLGDSRLEASGTLNDPSGLAAVQFNSSLALGQLGRLLKVEQKPQGLLLASGRARLLNDSSYLITSNVEGRDLSFSQGGKEFKNVSLSTGLRVDPKRIDVNGLRLGAFGGELTGNGGLEELARFHFDGQLHDFRTRTLMSTFAAKDLPYEGVISGPVTASGNLKAAGTQGLKAGVRLSIDPVQGGMPVSGKVNASYDGSTDEVSVADSYIALPNSRLDLSGALNQEIQIKLVSRNLSDFQPLTTESLPVKLRGGSLQVAGAVTGKLSAPQFAGHVEAGAFTIEDRAFDRLSADMNASPSQVKIQNGSLARAQARMQFNATAGLNDWKAEPSGALSVNATVQNADVADLMVLAGQKDVPITGQLDATAQIGGTIGSPRGGANLTVVKGTAYDGRFDKLTAKVDFDDTTVRLSQAQITAGAARADLNATFQHAKDHFDSGSVQARVSTNNMPLDPWYAKISGTGQIDADGSATLKTVKGQTEILLTGVNVKVSGRNVILDGRKLGDMNASTKTAGDRVDFTADSNFSGSAIRFTGQTRLEPDYPTNASASVSQFPIESVVASAKGLLTGTGQLTGTLRDPRATGDVTLTKAVIYDEPLDRLQAKLAYNNQLVEVQSLEVSEGSSRINASGALEHPKGDFEQGRFRFHVASNGIQLGRLHIVQQNRPGVNGVLNVAADGSGTLVKLPKGSTAPPVTLSTLMANIATHDLVYNRKPLGDATLKADTKNGDVAFQFDSDIGHSTIHGEGQTKLNGDFPTTALVKFSNVTYVGLRPLIASTSGAVRQDFDALAEGEASISGPLWKPEDLTGKLSIPKFVVTAKPPSMAAGLKPVSLQNQGPIVAVLNHRTIAIQSAHITGPNSDINISGTVAMNEKAPLNLQVSTEANLKLLQEFDRDIYSAGSASLQVAVRGTFAQPLVNGHLLLKNASVNMVDLPNGISHANGVIQFNGTSALVENLTAESGGGRVQLGGYVSFGGGTLRYGLRANAGQVRVRTAQGASVVAAASINLTGTSDHSVLAGNVTVNRIAFNPQSDFGSILSRSSPPPETPSAPSGPLAGMKLDIRIRTASDVAVQTALAQNLQTVADLTLRGTIANPGMLGRITVTSGKLVFFGSEYLVNSGSVSFFNPLKIDPILDLDLGTQAQGVDILLTVSGPVNNMKLTYRSDPPLQFNEIVGLLAAGKTPTSDPTILANQPATPPQNLEQMGESAIVSQAIASPVASRLQRVFGISKLKIDPTFTSGSVLPQARVTLQQQVASNVTFTYVTDVTQSNSQTIRVEWTVNPQWSAVATRDENGRFGVDFFYKKQFR